jgi:NAD(P)-dependent dehydrogenase (short-subunit alcohol dehydrogenase family)
MLISASPDAGSVRTLARRTEAELGPPWLVCNNSGASPFGPGWRVALAHLKRVIDVTLWGIINGVHVFASGITLFAGYQNYTRLGRESNLPSLSFECRVPHR